MTYWQSFIAIESLTNTSKKLQGKLPVTINLRYFRFQLSIDQTTRKSIEEVNKKKGNQESNEEGNQEAIEEAYEVANKLNTHLTTQK